MHSFQQDILNYGAVNPVAIECEDLDDPLYGDVDLTGTTVGSQAHYSCNEGFKLVGDRKRECQADGNWSGREPICECNLQICYIHAYIYTYKRLYSLMQLRRNYCIKAYARHPYYMQAREN